MHVVRVAANKSLIPERFSFKGTCSATPMDSRYAETVSGGIGYHNWFGATNSKHPIFGSLKIVMQKLFNGQKAYTGLLTRLAASRARLHLLSADTRQSRIAPLHSCPHSFDRITSRQATTSWVITTRTLTTPINVGLLCALETFVLIPDGVQNHGMSLLRVLSLSRSASLRAMKR